MIEVNIIKDGRSVEGKVNHRSVIHVYKDAWGDILVKAVNILGSFEDAKEFVECYSKTIQKAEEHFKTDIK